MSQSWHRRVRMFAAWVLVAALAGAAPAAAQTSSSYTLRGKALTLRLYGPASGEPVVLWSSDGGWVHLGPHAAEVLAAAGYYVIGLDSKQYLSEFTSGSKTLSEADVQRDLREVAVYAGGASHRKPIVIGVSEGAGLAVLAATAPAMRDVVLGVIGLGLPDKSELGWRWSDSVIYVTKGLPNEPTFSVANVIDRVAPLPLAVLHSTGDEFVPPDQVRAMMAKAGQPNRLWVITASNHRFSGNEAEFDRRLIEAATWVKANTPR
jgi:dienelactone hydrolase